MARRFRGTAVAENTETGDGRVWAPGAFTWEVPGPLAWIEAGDQHVDLVTAAPQIGVIESMERDGDVLVMAGTIDDATPAGAELVRRMEAGTASHGTRQGVSVDPDDWAFTVLAEGDGAEMVMLASTGEGRTALASTRALPVNAARMAVRPVTAAAGDPDPGDSPEGRIEVMVDASDSWLLRFTRSRIRGATCCAVPAFSVAMIELDGAVGDTGDAVDESDDAGELSAAAAGVVVHGEVEHHYAPPRAWFDVPEPAVDARGMVDVYGMPAEELVIEQPDGQLGVPLTIVERPDQGGAFQVYGNVALWDTCHIGYLPDCVTPPDSPAAYAHFHVGEVECADGSTIATGPLTVGCDHAAARLLAPEARDHYAHAGLTFADVRASSGTFGPWVAGACRPLSEDELRVVRASSLSGDWRRVGGALELVNVLAVNVPGFPIARETVLASGLSMVASAMQAPRVHYADGELVSMVAAGIVQRCPDCAARARARAERDADPVDRLVLDRLDRIDATLSAVELRTRNMRTAAAAELVARIRRTD